MKWLNDIIQIPNLTITFPGMIICQTQMITRCLKNRRKSAFNKCKWLMKSWVVLKNAKNMIAIEEGHIMRTNSKITHRGKRLKMGRNSIEIHTDKNTQGMSGSWLLQVSLCFGDVSQYWLKISMNSGI